MLTHDTLLEISNEEQEVASATFLHDGDDAEEVTPVEEGITELEEEVEVADEPGDEEEEAEGEEEA